ncbi:unnamed protein product, partial [Rotaria sordida]
MQLGKWIRLMHVLINTTNYEYGQVKDKMDATFTHRQRFIQEMKPTTEIVELYPSLSVEAIDADAMIQIQMIKNIKNYSIVIKYNTFITTNSQVEITVISLIG